MNKDTARGNTIKFEEFQKLPEGVIASGLISDSPDGIDIDGTNKILYYVVWKYNQQDWVIYCMRYETVKGMHIEDSYAHIANHGTKVTNDSDIKKVFNCSKKVLDLYTY